MKIILFLSVAFVFLFPRGVRAQGDGMPFAQDIKAFKKLDSLEKPRLGSILFVGSSSFTYWTGLSKAFPAYPVLNRGFGGSSLTDVIRYADEIIYPYKPKQVVIYCGENDIAGNESVSGKMVLERFRTLFSGIRKHLPGVPVVYVSMKPSPSRWQMRDRVMEGNRLISAFLAKQKGAKFVNVWNAMLGTDGKPMPDLFVEDNLHMNEKGYAIWKRILEPHLKR